MSIFDAMSPLEAVANDQRKVPERPVLQLATPDTPPVKEHDPGFDWNQWDAGWHNKPWAKGDIKHGRDIKPASPQSLSSPTHSIPFSEDLSHLPKCQKCGLTTKQHEMVKAYICGHLCRDIAHEKLCPDIGAPDVGRKDCPIHNPRTNSFPRRRSSLSKPPMLARDESTFEDVMEEETIENAKSADQSDAGNKVDLPQRKKKAAEEWQTPFLDRPVYHVSRDARGDADWRKHVRVEKAMKQILFGDARVSADVVLEHTQKVGMSERNLLRGRQASGNAEANIGEDLDYVDLRDAMAAAKAEAEKHTVKWAEQATAEPKAGPAAETEPSKHLPDCAVYSDEEIDAEDEFHDTLASRSISKTHRCMSEDECSSCAGGVNFPDDPRGSTPDILAEDDLLPWVGRSRTS